MSHELSHYTATANEVGARIITAYSTSFSASTRLLRRDIRPHIRNIYALVRIADELVDGVGRGAGLARDDVISQLDALRDETRQALASGFSTNLIVHAFAVTARAAHIEWELVEPFFASMRIDAVHDGRNGAGEHVGKSHGDYVFGSAQVVGLMCSRVFFMHENRARDPLDDPLLRSGAEALGAAFQNINFLRDIGHDTAALQRHYLGTTTLTSEEFLNWLATIDRQMHSAHLAINALPRSSRVAVRAAHSIFKNLHKRMGCKSVADVYRQRIRVPNTVKLVLISRAVITGGRR